MPKGKNLARKEIANAAYYWLSGFLIGPLLLLTTLNIEGFLKTPPVLGTQIEVDQSKDKLQEEKLFWEEVISKHPTYRDAYIELAQIESLLGNTKRVEERLEKAFSIDPNSQLVHQWQEKLL